MKMAEDSLVEEPGYPCCLCSKHTVAMSPNVELTARQLIGPSCPGNELM